MFCSVAMTLLYVYSSFYCNANCRQSQLQQYYLIIVITPNHTPNPSWVLRIEIVRLLYIDS